MILGSESSPRARGARRALLGARSPFCQTKRVATRSSRRGRRGRRQRGRPRHGSFKVAGDRGAPESALTPSLTRPLTFGVRSEFFRHRRERAPGCFRVGHNRGPGFTHVGQRVAAPDAAPHLEALDALSSAPATRAFLPGGAPLRWERFGGARGRGALSRGGRIPRSTTNAAASVSPLTSRAEVPRPLTFSTSQGARLLCGDDVHLAGSSHAATHAPSHVSGVNGEFFRHSLGNVSCRLHLRRSQPRRGFTHVRQRPAAPDAARAFACRQCGRFRWKRMAGARRRWCPIACVATRRSTTNVATAVSLL